MQCRGQSKISYSQCILYTNCDAEANFKSLYIHLHTMYICTYIYICIYIHIYIQAHICGTGAWWVQCLLIVANQPWHDTSHHPDFTFIKNTHRYGDIGLAFWYVLSKTSHKRSLGNRYGLTPDIETKFTRNISPYKSACHISTKTQRE